MVYSEYKPSKELKDIVKNYWRFEVTNDQNLSFPYQHETLPHSEVSIVFIKQPYFEGIRILGPQLKKFQKTIYPDSIYFGISILPWISFTPGILNKHEILNVTTDCPIPIANVLKSIKFDASTEPEPLILEVDNELKKMFTQTLHVSKYDLIKYICLELSSGKSVASNIGNIPISTRVIQKKFKEVVGMSMRKYQTIDRQRRLWSDFVKNEKDKTDLLYDYGFFDQAHFINDFKKHMDRSHKDFEERLRQITISLA
jgi:AraC-like DNA-binding protein